MVLKRPAQAANPRLELGAVFNSRRLGNVNPALVINIILRPASAHADHLRHANGSGPASTRRATAAREFLIAQGVKGSRISSIAYGKERPAALCDAEQCWSQNRRAVTVITGGANQ